MRRLGLGLGLIVRVKEIAVVQACIRVGDLLATLAEEEFPPAHRGGPDAVPVRADFFRVEIRA